MKHFCTLLVLLAGCGQRAAHENPPLDRIELEKGVNVMAESRDGSTQRFTVTRVAKFDDDLAYGGERGVYVIRDRQTARELVGISGVGIAELGSHTETRTRTSLDHNGDLKTTTTTVTVPDER